MIQMQLVRGEKDSPQTRPEVAFYEANGAVFCARHPFDARFSNLVMIAEPGKSFFDQAYANRFSGGGFDHAAPSLGYGDARAENRPATGSGGTGADAYGFVEFTRYVQADTRLTRRMVLTEEGMLVIADHLAPGESVDGAAAGSLWKLNAIDQRGENWFNQPVLHAFKPQQDAIDPRRWASELLVYHAKSPGRETGAFDWENVKGKRPNYRYTAYSKQTLRAGRPVTFVTVLVPHPERISAEEIARGIAPKVDEKGNVTVVIDRRDDKDGLRVTVRIDNRNGSWRVTRQKIDPDRNRRPTVRITSPAPLSTLKSDPLEVRAEASDPDGAIAKVGFYVNGKKVGEDTEAPYSVTLRRRVHSRGSRAPSDCYGIVAKAYDAKGAVGADAIAVKLSSRRQPEPPPTIEAHNDRYRVRAGAKSVLMVLGNDTYPLDRHRRPAPCLLNVTQPKHGKATVAGRGVLLLYTPNKGFAGKDRLTYTIGDSTGQRRTATVELTVTKGATR